MLKKEGIHIFQIKLTKKGQTQKFTKKPLLSFSMKLWLRALRSPRRALTCVCLFSKTSSGQSKPYLSYFLFRKKKNMEQKQEYLSTRPLRS
jgi:hypothetical protein